MHLTIDALGARIGAGATVLLELLDAALHDERLGKITVFCTPAAGRIFNFPDSKKLSIVEKPAYDRSYALRMCWYEFALGRECRRIGTDVLLIAANYGRSGNGMPFITFVRQSLQFSQEAIATHDRLFDRLKIAARRFQMRRSCRAASRVICQSSVMGKCVADQYGVPTEKIAVVYSAPRDFPTVSGPLPILDPMRQTAAGNRLLYVGLSAPYKKVVTAVRGTRLLRARRRDATLFMSLPEDDSCCKPPEAVGLDYLDSSALRQAYDLADVVVLPSLVESGPQVPIEAMSLGKPVLVADRPYAHDVCEDAAFFFDPLNPADFADKALQLLENEALRTRLVDAGYKLVKKRRASNPYQRIVDICVEEHQRSRSAQILS